MNRTKLSIQGLLLLLFVFQPIVCFSSFSEVSLACVMQLSNEPEIAFSLNLRPHTLVETLVSSASAPEISYKFNGQAQEISTAEDSKISLDLNIEKSEKGVRTKKWIFEREIFSMKQGFRTQISSGSRTPAKKSSLNNESSISKKENTPLEVILLSCKPSL